MCAKQRLLSLLATITLLGVSVLGVTAAASPAPLRILVGAPPSHIASISAREFAQRAGKAGVSVQVEADADNALDTAGAFALVRSGELTRAVPALTVLELPFLFSDINSVHRAFDGALGKALRTQARAAGWEILAFWDEGLRVLTGNRRYNDPLNLTGMEFLLLRADPMAERQFAAWDAWTRPTGAKTRGQLHAECLVGSREATLQQLETEEIHRVHLDLSLTEHRYEGWVLVVNTQRWSRLDPLTRSRLKKTLSKIQGWQRQMAAEREKQALDSLMSGGMQLHQLSAAQQAVFYCRLPAPLKLLSPSLSEVQAQRLLNLAHTSARKPGQRTAQPTCGAPKSEDPNQYRAADRPH